MFHLIKCSDVASPFVLQGKLCSFMASRITVTAFPLSFLPDLASLKVELRYSLVQWFWCVLFFTSLFFPFAMKRWVTRCTAPFSLSFDCAFDASLPHDNLVWTGVQTPRELGYGYTLFIQQLVPKSLTLPWGMHAQWWKEDLKSGISKQRILFQWKFLAHLPRAKNDLISYRSTSKGWESVKRFLLTIACPQERASTSVHSGVCFCWPLGFVALLPKPVLSAGIYATSWQGSWFSFSY